VASTYEARQGLFPVAGLPGEGLLNRVCIRIQTRGAKQHNTHYWSIAGNTHTCRDGVRTQKGCEHKNRTGKINKLRAVSPTSPWAKPPAASDLRPSQSSSSVRRVDVTPAKRQVTLQAGLRVIRSRIRNMAQMYLVMATLVPGLIKMTFSWKTTK
jgi:hypothetical protein